ncbi:hypothetical protein [Rouxiella sp. Mn2063]|uniref:hypothetical protein n=1 Tax=Rouxiella sp. Mn2063 TaxID=3395262 RepID=UPI003BE4D57C
MRKILVLLLSLLLTGCINLSSPQGAQYKAEYANRLDIRTQNVYRFMNKAVRPMGDSNAQDDYLAGFFSLSGAENSILELRFNYPAKSLQVTSLDRQNHVIAERTYLLLDKSEAPPTNKDIDYFYLTKDGECSGKLKLSTGLEFFQY